MPNRGNFIGSQDNLYVPDAPTIGSVSGATSGEASVAFTAPSDVGNDDITAYGVSATDGTNVIGATGSSSPVTLTGLTNGTSYTARVWAINDYGNGPLSAATSSFTPIATTVGLIAGGSASGGNVNVIQKIVPEVAGNATDFGDLSATKANLTASGNDIRFIAVGGGTGGSTKIDVMEFVNYASAGNVTDFGNMTESRDYVTCASNNVRLMNIGGDKTSSGGRTDTVDYVTIQSAGNATDFANLTATTKEANNGNKSQVHWDMVSIQRPEWGGGEIWFDGELIRKDGVFVAKDLEKLNPSHLLNE